MFCKKELAIVSNLIFISRQISCSVEHEKKFYNLGPRSVKREVRNIKGYMRFTPELCNVMAYKVLMCDVQIS